MTTRTPEEVAEMITTFRDGVPCLEVGVCRVRESGCLCTEAADTLTSMAKDVERLEGELLVAQMDAHLMRTDRDRLAAELAALRETMGRAIEGRAYLVMDQQKIQFVPDNPLLHPHGRALLVPIPEEAETT